MVSLSLKSVVIASVSSASASEKNCQKIMPVFKLADLISEPV